MSEHTDLINDMVALMRVSVKRRMFSPGKENRIPGLLPQENLILESLLVDEDFPEAMEWLLKDFPENSYLMLLDWAETEAKSTKLTEILKRGRYGWRH